MRAVLVSRYPRVDTPGWKRHVAGGLLDAGIEVAVLYSRSSLADQLRAGLREFGLQGAREKFVSLRSRGSANEPPAPSPDDAGDAQALGTWARERGYEVAECSRLGDAGCLEQLGRLRPDLLLLTGADIVPTSVLEVPTVGTLNAHYGLLPAYRGMNVTEWSIFYDDPVGVTIHFVDPGIDTGDIALREEIDVVPGDTLESLRGKHQAAASRMLVEAACRLRDGNLERVTQQPDEGRQYYRMHPALRAFVERKLADCSYRYMEPAPTGSVSS
jgi:methionyl-tRNA formyltransferase